MKRFLSLAIAILIALNIASVNAKIRTSAEVLTIAQQHFATKTAKARSTSPQIVNTISASEILSQPKTRSGSIGGEPFYILVASNGSNVIVSGDDRMLPILGYSDNGFDKNNMNAGFKELLFIYGDIYNDIQLNGGSMQSPPKSYATTSLPASVPRLLGETEWDQAAPYNNIFPTLESGAKAVTGCVATATAMVMRYHKHPERATGVGIGKYNEIPLDKEPFLWDKMLDKYRGTYDPAENQAAVAWLMRAVSAALNTYYNDVSAGSSHNYAVQALVDNFGYDRNLSVISRRTRTSQEWNDMMKTEIVGRRPVVYGAGRIGFGEGHAFVLDAYENEIMFHVNWGWSGINNGYYPITSLNGYVTGQEVIIGFQKPTDLPYVSVFSNSGGKMDITPTTVARNGVFSLASDSYTNRVDTFTGEIGLVLFKDGEAVATVGPTQSFSNIQRVNGVKPIFKNVSIPPEVLPGSYQIYVATKAVGEPKWQPIRMPLDILPYYNVEISTSGVVFTSPIVKAVPQLISFTPDSDKIYYKEEMGFTAIIQNDGTEYSEICDIRVTSIATGKVERFDIRQLCVLLPGRNEIRFTKAIPLPPGEYKLELVVQVPIGINIVYEPMSGSENVSNIKILGDNFEKYDYYVILSPIVTKLNVTNKDATPQVTFDMTNVGSKDITSGTYFTLTTTGQDMAGRSIIPQQISYPVSITKGETQEVTLKAPLELPDGNYTFRIAINYPLGNNAPAFNTSYNFGVRTLGNGK